MLRNTLLHCETQQGGAIAADFNSFVTVSNSSIRNCQAVIGGAVLSAENLTLQAVVIDTCSAEQSGGAVHSTAEGYATSTGCTFSRNKVCCTHTSACTIAATAAAAAAAAAVMPVRKGTEQHCFWPSKVPTLANMCLIAAVVLAYVCSVCVYHD
jgi:hypothetical protein